LVKEQKIHLSTHIRQSTRYCEWLLYAPQLLMAYS
jgi:hypothetical protein